MRRESTFPIVNGTPSEILRTRTLETFWVSAANRPKDRASPKKLHVRKACLRFRLNILFGYLSCPERTSEFDILCGDQPVLPSFYRLHRQSRTPSILVPTDRKMTLSSRLDTRVRGVLQRKPG